MNPWTIGIGTGIVSGVCVLFITWLISTRKGNSIRLQRINATNAEIVKILMPYVADNGLPDISVVNAILASVARRNNVSVEDLFSARIYCEDLIREIVSDTFVSSELKKKYVGELANFVGNINEGENEQVDKKVASSLIAEETRIEKQRYMRITFTVSMVVISFVLMIVSTFVPLFNGTDSLVLDGFTNSDVFFMAAVAASTLGASISLFFLLKKWKI